MTTHTTGIAAGNAEMAAAWDGQEGDQWTEYADYYEATGPDYDRALLGALEVDDASEVLDVGCGTGALTVEAARRVPAGSVLGVDLSARMLEKARALGVYDRLAHADIVEFLAASPDRFDLVLAADVFIYVGDLARVFALLERAMARGVFCFSVEALDDDAADVRLLPSLRYAHSRPYLVRLATQHGFEVAAIDRAAVREEQGVPIEGLYLVLRRLAR